MRPYRTKWNFTTLFVFFVLSVIASSCNEQFPSEKSASFQKGLSNIDDRDASQQITGYVSFPDGSHPQDSPLIRAYYLPEEEYVQDSEDEIEPNGHYGCSGDNNLWPTGWYHLETDVIYKDGKAWYGYRNSYHIYMTPTTGQNITLSNKLEDKNE